MAKVRDLHPAVRLAAGTGGAYLLLLGLMFVLFFVIPFMAFRFI